MSTSTQWQLAREAAQRYEQILVPAILGPAAKALVERATLRGGETVLDVGCGTGAAARSAAEQVGPTGRVVGVDLNAGMIEVARSLPPPMGAQIEWREASALDLPLPSASVDVVLCAQTLQFVAERPKAVAEMRRVLKAGGRVAISLWCAIDENPYFDALAGAVSRHIGHDVANGLRAAFSLSNENDIRELLAGSEFQHVEVSIAQLDLDLPPLSSFIPRHVSATPMAAGFSAAGAETQQAVIAEVARRLDSRLSVAGAQLPFRTHLAFASA